MPNRRSIFLSYRRQETGHLAGRLADRLFSEFGEAHVFMDVDSIAPGRDFGEAIERALNECAVLLALIGPAWTGAVDTHGRRRLDDPDDLVVLELQAALNRAIPVIPVLVDGATAPTRDDLPATLGALARRQALRIDHDTFRTDCAALLHHVTRIVAEAGEQDATDLARPSDDTRGIITAKIGADSSLGEEDRETEQEQARREQQAQEAARQEHARQEHARQEHARQEHARQEHARQEHARQEHARQEHARQEHARQEHARQEHSRQEHSRQEHSRQEHARQEHARQEHARQEHSWREHAWRALQAPTARTQPALPAWRDAEQSAPRPRRNSRTQTLLDVLAVVAGGAIIAAVLSFGAGPEPGPAALAVAAPAAAPAATPTTAPPVGDDPVAFVMDYYGLLPGNTDAAWALLSPAAQEAAGGRSGFDHFYGTIRSVSLPNVLESDDSTVDATVVYVAKVDGSTASEPYRFVVGPGPDGRLLIQSISRL